MYRVSLTDLGNAVSEAGDSEQSRGGGLDVDTLLEMRLLQIRPAWDERLVRAVIVLALVVIAYLLVARIGRRALMRLAGRGGDIARTARAETLWSMLRRLLLVAVIVLLAMEMSAIWGLSVAPLLALGSAVGVAVGLGAQTLVKDVIAGFFILAESQFHIGDTVRVADVIGTVVDVRPRITVLRDGEGNIHYVPNGAITVASNLVEGRSP